MLYDSLSHYHLLSCHRKEGEKRGRERERKVVQKNAVKFTDFFIPKPFARKVIVLEGDENQE